MSSGKKKLAIIVVILLLAAIPATFYLALREQEFRGRAAPATTLAFDPASVSKTVGETFTFNVQINTGSNSISGAELHVQYDTTKLSGISIDIASNPFLPLVLVDGAIAPGGFAFITLGSQPSAPKQGTGTLATVTFRALASTGGAPTLVRFTTDTRVAGTGEIGSVLASQPAPASVTIAAATSPAPTATPTPTVTTPKGVATPTPTPRGIGGVPTSTPALTKVATSSATPSASPAAKGGPLSPQPTAGEIPVAADVRPTTVLTIGGIVLFIVGIASLFAL